jgi:hypothetical protein
MMDPIPAEKIGEVLAVELGKQPAPAPATVKRRE